MILYACLSLIALIEGKVQRFAKRRGAMVVNCRFVNKIQGVVTHPYCGLKIGSSEFLLIVDKFVPAWTLGPS